MTIEIFMRGYDPEDAPVLAYCHICDGEIYDNDELDRFGGVCAECAARLALDEETEEEDAEI